MRLCRIKTKFLEFIFVLGQAVALHPNKQTKDKPSKLASERERRASSSTLA